MTEISRYLTSARRKVARLGSGGTSALSDPRQTLNNARRALRVRTGLPNEVAQAISGVREEDLSFLHPEPLQDLALAVIDADKRGLEGDLIETGTARGGSAIVIAQAKAPERKLRVYDVFGLIPPPTDRDGSDVHERYETIAAGKAEGVGGGTYYGYRDDLLGEVSDSFARHGVPVQSSNVELIKGLFEDTLKVDGPVAFAHLDGDWYESTKVCLERIAPRLVPGGRIVLDDYDAWSGCRTAADEYFSDRREFRLERHARLHAVRV